MPLGIGIGLSITHALGTGVPPPVADWIFADGTWSDAGFWQDIRSWDVTGLFIASRWWDGGTWDDGEDW
jgi:hypothetical protein